jgi:hypothetical protein
MRRKITSIAVLLVMVFAAFAVMMPSVAALPPYSGPDYELNQVPTAWETPRNYYGAWGDDSYGAFLMPFTFTLYDRSTNVVYVSTNGYVDFNPGGYWKHREYWNWAFSPFPFNAAWGWHGCSEYTIAAFWEDLYQYWWNPGQGIYYDQYSDHVTITWISGGYGYYAGNLQFQVQLYSSGMVQINYRNIYQPYPWYNPTVGINRGDGVYGTTYWYGSYGTGGPVYNGLSLATGAAVTTTIEIVDYAVNRDPLAAGARALGRIVVENTGPNDADIRNMFLGGTDLAELIVITSPLPDKLAPGEQHTFEFFFVLYAGTPDGMMTGVDLIIEYNSDTGDPLEFTLGVMCKWKENGNDRSEAMHGQDSARHILALWKSIQAGYCDDNGELADAFQSHLDGKYKEGKNTAVNVPGVKGPGHFGDAPGQTQGSEGNGNGGLPGNMKP